MVPIDAIVVNRVRPAGLLLIRICMALDRHTPRDAKSYRRVTMGWRVLDQISEPLRSSLMARLLENEAEATYHARRASELAESS